jgi:hypothetical protein
LHFKTELRTNHSTAIMRMYVHSTTRKLRPVCRSARTLIDRTPVGLLTRRHSSREDIKLQPVTNETTWKRFNRVQEKLLLHQTFDILYGYETWRFSRFLGNRLTDSGEAVLCAGRALPSGRFLVLISVPDWVDSRATVRLEGVNWKNPVTSSGF